MRPFIRLRLFSILVLFTALPFFEGSESATGLFLVHTLTLAGFLYCIAKAERAWLPTSLLYFAPFLVLLLLSAYIANYKFSAFLELWDCWVAAVFAFTLFNVLKADEEGLDLLLLASFLAGTAAFALSTVVGWQRGIPRWSGTFTNVNEYATYALLLLILGIYLIEKASNRTHRIFLLAGVLILATCTIMASSRSVFLASIAVLIVYLWHRKPPKWISAGLVAFVLVSAGFLAFRFMHAPDVFQYYRLKIWKYSLQGILQDPYLGIGLHMLPYRAAQFNFPADLEVGRFAMMATSADNQYLQILIETGFLGFFLFVIGWVMLFLSLRKLPERFALFRLPFLILTIVGCFAIPLNNTAILFLFLFLISFPFALSGAGEARPVDLKWSARIPLIILTIALFLVAVLIPYLADRSFHQAITARNPQDAERYLNRAIKLNPYQPYYPFIRISRLVIAKPKLTEEQWLSVQKSLQHSIDLNPLESDFYIYQARIYEILEDLTHDSRFHSLAVASYQAALERSPYQVFQRANFAYFLYSSGEYRDATRELKRILDLEPAYLDARLLLCEVLFRAGDVEGARKELALLEELEKRYEPMKPSVPSPYVRKLLELNVQLKIELKRLIMNVPQN